MHESRAPRAATAVGAVGHGTFNIWQFLLGVCFCLMALGALHDGVPPAIAMAVGLVGLALLAAAL